MLNQLLLFLPWCWFVNMCLTFLGYGAHRYALVRRLDIPLDGGVRLPDGHRLLGDSTTWLGLLLVGVLGWVGELLHPEGYFFLLSLLVYLGHLVGSFIKRRLGIPRGGFLFGVDHIDYVVLAGIVLGALGQLSLAAFSVGVLGTLFITPAITWIAWRTGIRTRPL